MQVMQVKLNQETSFGKRRPEGGHMPASERKAAHAIANSGHTVDRQPHGWFVFKQNLKGVRERVLALHGKSQSYAEVARHLSLSV